MKRPAIVFFTVFLLLAGANIALNLFVNPFGFFGDESVGAPPVFNARYEKYRHIQRMEHKPELLVLGSSNAMRMLPATLEAYSGLKTFNYGVFHATAEDYYCLGELLTAQPETTPKVVFLCLDDWNFAEKPQQPDQVFLGAGNRLSYKPRLAGYLDDYSALAMNWARVKTTLSWRQSKSSLSVLREAMSTTGLNRNTPSLSQIFELDGTRKKYASVHMVDITALAEKGEYDVSADLRKRHEELLTHSNYPIGFLSETHEMFEEFSETRWNYFERFVANMQKHQVKLIINIMPTQPYYQRLIQEHSNYDSRIEQLLIMLGELQVKYDNILLVADNHKVERFGGLENHFFDHLHPTSRNSDLMIKAVFNQLPADALQ